MFGWCSLNQYCSPLYFTANRIDFNFALNPAGQHTVTFGNVLLPNGLYIIFELFSQMIQSGKNILLMKTNIYLFVHLLHLVEDIVCYSVVIRSLLWTSVTLLCKLKNYPVRMPALLRLSFGYGSTVYRSNNLQHISQTCYSCMDKSSYWTSHMPWFFSRGVYQMETNGKNCSLLWSKHSQIWYE